MTTDHQKILEAAAKACGLRKDDSPYNGVGAGNTGFDLLGNLVLDWDDMEVWNSLDDSADCAEMCAKLDINHMWFDEYIKCWQWKKPPVRIEHNGTDEDKKAAWRLAASIVAAKIGGYTDE